MSIRNLSRKLKNLTDSKLLNGSMHAALLVKLKKASLIITIDEDLNIFLIDFGVEHCFSISFLKFSKMP